LEAIDAALRDPATQARDDYVRYPDQLGMTAAQNLQEEMLKLEYEIYHQVISAKSFDNKLSVSRRNPAKDVADPMKKYVRIWILVHSSALYSSWEQNTKKGLHEAEVYIMNNRHIFQADKKTKGAFFFF
jgi:hypothetical protein